MNCIPSQISSPKQFQLIVDGTPTIRTVGFVLFDEDNTFWLTNYEENHLIVLAQNEDDVKHKSQFFTVEEASAVTTDSITETLDKEGEDSMHVWLNCPQGVFDCRVLRPRIKNYSTEYSAVNYDPVTHFWIKYPHHLNIKVGSGFGGSPVLSKDLKPVGMLRAVNSEFHAALCVLLKPVLEVVIQKHPNIKIAGN